MRFGKSYVWFREDASMLRFLASAVVVPLTISMAAASPFYVGTWSPDGGLCDGTAFSITSYTLIYPETECRLAVDDADETTAVADAVCADTFGSFKTNVLLEHVDGDMLRMTPADKISDPGIYRRCSP
jgi:hypothetical protein